MLLKRPVSFKRGDKGPFIADVQEMLARLGFDPGQPEGVFVSKTEDAVRAFQREHGLEVTGVIDCKTLKALYEEADPGGYPAVLMEGGEAPESPSDGGGSDSGTAGGQDGEEGQGAGVSGSDAADPGAADARDTAGGEGVSEGGQRSHAPAKWVTGAFCRLHELLRRGALRFGEGKKAPRRVGGKEATKGGGARAATGSATSASSAAAIMRATATSGAAPATNAAAAGSQRTIVISVGERTLGLYEGDRLVRRYPVAIGKPSTPTPVGTHRILEKVMHPGGGLGTRWMAFTYEMHGIHGTNRPELIGQAVSNGCVRMHNENVEELYDMVDVGTPVAVIVGALEAWPGLGKPAGTGAGQPAAQGPGLGGPVAGPGGSGQGGSTAQPGGGTGQGAGAVPAPTGGTGMPGGGLGTPGSPQPKDAQAGRTYTVQPGDSLWSIAQRFATTVAAIVAANNIRNPDLIYPGEVLRIP
ncbi:MAG: L,D-transpeptidase family protein [Bacillota bacterium]